jgi:hypothetical protein
MEYPRYEVASSGDHGFTRCIYAMTVTDPATKKPVQDRGSVVEVYKKQADGYWKSVSDLAASEVPPEFRAGRGCQPATPCRLGLILQS